MGLRQRAVALCVLAESGLLAEKVDVFISHFLESIPYPEKLGK